MLQQITLIIFDNEAKTSREKNFVLETQNGYFDNYDFNTLIYSKYNGLFRVYIKSCTHVATEYLSGLLQCEKGHKNMERMVEEVTDSEYKRYVHFLSVSK